MSRPTPPNLQCQHHLMTARECMLTPPYLRSSRQTNIASTPIVEPLALTKPPIMRGTQPRCHRQVLAFGGQPKDMSTAARLLHCRLTISSSPRPIRPLPAAPNAHRC